MPRKVPHILNTDSISRGIRTTASAVNNVFPYPKEGDKGRVKIKGTQLDAVYDTETLRMRTSILSRLQKVQEDAEKLAKKLKFYEHKKDETKKKTRRKSLK